MDISKHEIAARIPYLLEALSVDELSKGVHLLQGRLEENRRRFSLEQ